LSLQPQDFPVSMTSSSSLEDSQVAEKISKASALVRTLQTELEQAGYEVQTVRIATNPFGEWIQSSSDNKVIDMMEAKTRLQCLNQLLEKHGITFCAVGPAQTNEEIQSLCMTIIETCPYVSCSATVRAGDVEAARATAQCIRKIASLPGTGGLGNFRFCAAADTCQPGIPFFPAAKSASTNGVGDDGLVGFALGLENGPLAQHWLAEAGSIAKIPTIFKDGMAVALSPVQGAFDFSGYINAVMCPMHCNKLQGPGATSNSDLIHSELLSQNFVRESQFSVVIPISA
jgi:uncharacterized protein